MKKTIPEGSQLLQFLVQKLTGTISIVKEAALACICALFENCGDELESFYNELCPFVFKIYQEHKADVYKYLRGLVIETLTCFANCMKNQKDKFMPYFE